MTFATIGSNETNNVKTTNIKTFGAAVLAHINAFCAERKELKNLYHYERDATLARAQRDVNRVWLG